MSEVNGAFDPNAYYKVITMVVPPGVDLAPVFAFADANSAVGMDNAIHKDAMTEENAWKAIGAGIGRAYLTFFRKAEREIAANGTQ